MTQLIFGPQRGRKVNGKRSGDGERQEKQMIDGSSSLSDNQRALLDLVRVHQPVKRSALTEMTDLKQQSVHRIVKALEDGALIAASSGPTDGPGKPSPLLSLNAQASFGVGLLVNTDFVEISVVDLNCDVVAEARLYIEVSDRRAALVEVKTALDALLVEAEIPPNRICGLGFTLPGFFVHQHRGFNAPELLQDWSLIDLRPELEALFGLPVILENSANAGAIGETLGEIGCTYKDFVYLGFDFGFGGAIVLDGRLHTGRYGNAGELSAIWVGDESANRPAMGLLLKHLRRHGVSLSGIDELRREFDPEWPGLEEWITSVVPQLNRLIFGLAGIVDPEAIVFGGQIAPDLAQMLIDRVSYPDSYRYDTPPPLPKLVLGSPISNPAAKGVAQLPLKRAFFV